MDRILLGLIGLNVSFARVGSLKKISKQILPYVISKRMDHEKCNALEELQDMLEHDVLSQEEVALVKSAMDDISSGRAQRREQALRTTRIVGTTCASARFPILDMNCFPIIILDEASQMTEPMSMFPLRRFQCQWLVCHFFLSRFLDFAGCSGRSPPATSSAIHHAIE